MQTIVTSHNPATVQLLVYGTSTIMSIARKLGTTPSDATLADMLRVKRNSLHAGGLESMELTWSGCMYTRLF
jgi:hypothetical protein